MVLDSQVQILLDLQAQHPLTVRADWGSHLFSKSTPISKPVRPKVARLC